MAGAGAGAETLPQYHHAMPGLQNKGEGARVLNEFSPRPVPTSVGVCALFSFSSFFPKVFPVISIRAERVYRFMNGKGQGAEEPEGTCGFRLE